MIVVFHHCGLLIISNMEFLFSWVTRIFVSPNSKIYLSNQHQPTNFIKILIFIIILTYMPPPQVGKSDLKSAQKNLEAGDFMWAACMARMVRKYNKTFR